MNRINTPRPARRLITRRQQTLCLATLVATATLLSPANPARAQCNGTWTQKSPPVSPTIRDQHAMAFDTHRNATVLFGGYVGGGNYDNQTWEYNGFTWVQKLPVLSPAPRGAHAMVFDSGRNVIVLFGGYIGGGLYDNETWEFDGANWTKKNPANKPSPRAGHAMTYDIVRGKTILFGGFDPAGYNDQTWAWDGSDWSNLAPATKPSPRMNYAMTFDTRRGVAVLFGGLTSGLIYNGQTWEWNGVNWTNRAPAAPPAARAYHAMAYDKSRGVSVLFGGTPGGNQTWEWDGTTWAQRQPVPQPSDRSTHAMAFDSNRGVTVLFGGQTGATLDAQTWEWTGPLPYVMQQPATQMAQAGQSAAFTVAVSSGANLAYQWRMGGVPLADGGVVSGATTDTLHIGPVTAADSGSSFDCRVTSLCGTTISQTAALVVIIDACAANGSGPDCNANGILDSCDITSNPSLDANQNGVLDSCDPPAPPVPPGGDPCAVSDPATDCNANGVLDSCDIAANAGLDANQNGMLDACEAASPSPAEPGNEPPVEAPLESPNAAPCGVCGGGVAAIMPMAFAAMGARACRRKIRMSLSRRR